MMNRGHRPSLETLGSHFGTDKASSHHGYLEFYERFFAGLRDQPITLLEIGVFRGQSVAMWHEYFPEARIIGVDIAADARRHARDRLIIEIADQSNVKGLVQLGTKYGPLDIVVDDGSHIWHHQILTLQYLFPFLKPGGYFVVEDIDTSFGDVKDFQGTGGVTMFQYLTHLTKYLVADARLDLRLVADGFIRSYSREIEFVTFHRRAAVLRRRGSQATAELFRNPPALWSGELRSGDAPPSGSLMVHVGIHGDIPNTRDFIGGVQGTSIKIQGFMISLDNRAADELQYRGLLQDNSWSDWVSPGTFVGTRGVNSSLHGFAVRLSGRLARQFECICVGAFAGEPDLVQAADGEDCRAPIPSALEAMQIVFQPRGRAKPRDDRL